MVARILGHKAREVGLRFSSFPVQLAVGLSGLLFGVIEYLILAPEPKLSLPGRGMAVGIDISVLHWVCEGVHLSWGVSANCNGGVRKLVRDNLGKPVICCPAYGLSFPD
ncbi:hypothetical protein ES703_65527 [subsurface metagenome]